MKTTKATMVLLFALLCAHHSPIAGQSTRAWQQTLAPQQRLITDLVANDSVLVAAIYGMGVATNHLGDTSWTTLPVSKTDNYVSAAVLYDSSLLVVGTARGNVFTSSDYGHSWVNVPTPFYLGYVYDMVQAEGSIYIGTDQGVVRLNLTVEGSDAWYLERSTTPTPVYALYYLEGVVYAGGRGVIYSRATNNTFIASEQITYADILDIKAVRDRIVVATAGDYFYSRGINSDGRWRQRQNEKSTSITYAMLAHGDRLFKGSNGRGVIESENDSELGLESAEVTALCLFGGRLYAGTREIGVLVRDIQPRDVKSLPMSNDLLAATKNLKQTISESSIQLYPNPVANLLTVDLVELNILPTNVTILNSNGQRLFSGKPSAIKFTLDVSAYAPGLYEFVSTFDGHRTVTPFIVSR